MIRVTEAISDTNIGGAGRLLLARLSCTDRRKIQTTVILPKGSSLVKPLREMKISVCEVCCKADSSWDAHAILLLAHVIYQQRPHLFHAHGWLSARVAARLVGVPVSIYTRHCAFDLTWLERFPVTQLVQRYLCELLSDKVIAVSPAARDNLISLGIRKSQIKVIINGSLAVTPQGEAERLERKRRLGIPNDAVVVGILARLEPCKDHACFLRAAKRLLEHPGKKRYRFLIVGDGSLMNELKNQSRGLGISNEVIFTGFLQDPSPILDLFDMNVNCSIGTETSSLALSEGMSLGIPSIASNFGGNPYMVKDGENGFLYQRGNDKMLAERIRTIAENSLLASQMSQNAKERFERELNAVVMTRQYEALYSDLLEKKRSYLS